MNLNWLLGAALGGVFVALVGCSSDDGPDSDTTAAGGSSDTGAESSGGSAAEPTGTGGESLQPLYGDVGSGQVVCGADSCAAGTLCCGGITSTGDVCVSDFDDCECTDTWCGKYACDGPEDCPGQLCCVTTWSGYGGNIRWAGSSCKDACDPVMDAVACDDDSDCPSNGFGCSTSSAGFGLQVCP